MPRRTPSQSLAAALDLLADALTNIARRAGKEMASAVQPPKRRGRPPKAAAKPRRSRMLSPKARKRYRLMGTYMGLVRTLPAAKKAELKKLRQAKGYVAAIAAARKMAGK